MAEIMLPEYAPKRFFNRSTLWNEVEQVEKNYNAQLAYSFDMALQNEFSLEENIELAKEFVQKYFVSDGMIVDLAIHKPDRDEGGIPNSAFSCSCSDSPSEYRWNMGIKAMPRISFG